MGCDCRHTTPKVRSLETFQDNVLSIKYVSIDFCRTVMRLLLLSRDGALLVRPLVPGLDRSLLTRPQPPPAPPASTEPGSVRLPRSGRVLRTLASSPPPHLPRDWAPPGHITMVTTMLKVESNYQQYLNIVYYYG